MINKIFKNKKFNTDKLKTFGFIKENANYVYKTNLMDNEFALTVYISDKNEIKTELTEVETGDIYTLHLTDSEGTFVGRIRTEYENILSSISENCFDTSIFKYENSHKVLEYVNKKYSDNPEYLWEKFPENAVVRRKDNKKWYLAILTVKKNKLGFESDEYTEVIDLRAPADEVPDLLKQDYIYPAYHMNKKHWITIMLDGSTDINEIYKHLDISYKLADKK